MPGQFTGSLLHRYYIDVSADPGGAQPDRHRDDAPDGETTRDQASMGGAWTPEEWLTDAHPVLPGGPGAGPQSHDAHTDQRDGGERRPDYGGQGPADRNHGGAATAASLNMAGAAGAAFGGLVKTGSMEPRANPGGVRLGDDYTIAAEQHRQGLHFNRPGLRLIRAPATNHENRDDVAASPRFSRASGLKVPRLRHILPPTGRAEMDPIDQAPELVGILDPGPIGGDWVR